MDIKEELFREDYLFTREDVLKSLELFFEHEKLNEEPGYSNEVVKNRVKLCKEFIATVKNGYALSKGYPRQMKVRLITLSKSRPGLECLVSLGFGERGFAQCYE